MDTSPHVKGTREAEAKVQSKLQLALEEDLRPYKIEAGKSLIYKIEIEPDGNVTHQDKQEPSRGQLAFETDLLISSVQSTPLVAIELKYGTFSSHDVITYSWKASRHKQVYPYLRYGLVVAGADLLGRRFVIHNEAFDFALALPEGARSIKETLLPLLRRQIASAEALVSLMRLKRITLRRFEQNVEVEL